MTTNNPTNPIQTLKLWVMINSIVAMMAIMLVFFGADVGSSSQTALTSDTDFDKDMNSVAFTTPQSTNEFDNKQSDELKGLPYVSRQGLQQQAKQVHSQAQVVSYQRQPRVRAGSSR